MTDMSLKTAETPSGKGAGDENFPVGSLLLPRRLRPHVAIFYAFARAIDDVADNPDLAPEEKVRRLDGFDEALLGQTDDPALAKAHAHPRKPERDRCPGRALPRPDRRLQAGRGQAALRRLGRPDRLLRPARPRRSGATCSTCTANPARAIRARTRCATRCRCSTTCRTAATTTARSTGSTCRRTGWRPKAARCEALDRAGASPGLAPRARPLPRRRPTR